MANSSRFKQLILLLIGVAFLFVQIWTSYIVFQYPYLGIEAAVTEENTWYISDFYEDGTAAQIGFALHDEIVLINDSTVEKHASVYKFHTIEKAYSIEVNRDGTRHIFDLRDRPVELSSRILFALITEFVLIAVAVFLILKVRPSRSVYYLIAMLMTMGLAFISAEGSSQSDAFSKFVTFNAMSFIPFLFALFIYHFLKEKGYKLFKPRWLTSCMVLLSIIAVSRAIYFLNAPIYMFYVIDRSLTLFCFAGGSLLVVILLVFIYRKNRLEYSFSAMIIKIVFQAFIVSFVPFMLLSVAPDLFGKPIVQYTQSIWFIVLFPVTFIYCVIKYKLPQNKSILLSLLPMNQHQLISFNLLLSGQGQTSTLTDIERYLLPQICFILDFDAIAIRIQDRGNIRLVVHGQLNSAEMEQAVLNGTVRDSNYMVYAIHPKYDFSSHLILKRKLPYKAISTNKQSCIDVLIAWLAITLENIYLSESLTKRVEELFAESAAAADRSGEHYLWFKNTLYQMQEKERRRIAAELHDSVMQDIYFAKQRVVDIRGGSLQPSIVDEELKELADYLDIINSHLRDTNFQLYPHLLKEVGFSETISNLIENERLNVPFHLNVRIEQKTEWNQLDSDTHHHLFRIMQELISNAKKHSCAKEVKFYLWKRDTTMTLEYSDNGVGFDHHIVHEGAGLLGIQHRVSSFEGKLHINAIFDKGVTITITVPATGGEAVDAGDKGTYYR